MSVLYRFAGLLSGVWGAPLCFIGFIQAPFQRPILTNLLVLWGGASSPSHGPPSPMAHKEQQPQVAVRTHFSPWLLYKSSFPHFSFKCRRIHAAASSCHSLALPAWQGVA
jgi:hypothetical protein